MSLRDEILALVAVEPDIRSTTLQRRTGVTRDSLGHCLQKMRRDGLIESTFRGRYRIAGTAPPEKDDEVKEKPVKRIASEPSTLPERAPAPGSDSKRHARYSPSTFISPPSRDRLMSGR
jgi:hypothetical protein